MVKSRGKYGKPQRGGGKSFSRNLQPLDEQGNETNTPDRWEPRKKRDALLEAGAAGSSSDDDDDEDDEEDSEEDDESEDSDGNQDKTNQSANDRPGPSSSSTAQKTTKPSAKSKGPISGEGNLNAISSKAQKASSLNSSEPQEMSRRDREAMEKKAAAERYQKLHAAGKTDQAKADLARLAIIKQKREDAKRQREAEGNAKVEEARIAMERSKGIGKKT